MPAVVVDGAVHVLEAGFWAKVETMKESPKLILRRRPDGSLGFFWPGTGLLRGTTTVSLYDRPFQTGENLWSYAERYLRDIEWEGASITGVTAEAVAIDLTAHGDCLPQCKPGAQTVRISYAVRLEETDWDASEEDPT